MRRHSQIHDTQFFHVLIVVGFRSLISVGGPWTVDFGFVDTIRTEDPGLQTSSSCTIVMVETSVCEAPEGISLDNVIAQHQTLPYAAKLPFVG